MLDEPEIVVNQNIFSEAFAQQFVIPVATDGDERLLQAVALAATSVRGHNERYLLAVDDANDQLRRVRDVAPDIMDVYDTCLLRQRDALAAREAAATNLKALILQLGTSFKDDDGYVTCTWKKGREKINAQMLHGMAKLYPALESVFSTNAPTVSISIKGAGKGGSDGDE